MDSKVTIKIPRELYHNLGEMIEGTGFSSVNEFIVFVMRTLAMGGGLKQSLPMVGFSADEVHAIRERLRKLGYLKETE